MIDVPQMIAGIEHAFNVNDVSLAKMLDVSQPTIHRWRGVAGLKPTKPTAKNLKKLQALHYEALCHSFHAGDFSYLCSFAPKYTEELAEGAERVLRSKLLDTPFLARPLGVRESEEIQIDLYVRAAGLPRGVRAHCYANDDEDPTVFIVLVNNRLKPLVQHRVAWGEVYAHVVKKLEGLRRSAKLAPDVLDTRS